ncbi:MAG: hypothetical protein KF716_20475 [Anaerolineae bacterium]|nr:hypothetical protein [Anaerolineae bacterium]
MSTKLRDETDQRALGAMLREAFFSWPSAVIIGFVMVMFALNVLPFAFWQSWMWLVFGVLAEGAYLWSTLTDPVAAQQAVARMLQEKYDPNDIRNLHARQQLRKALEYKTNIDAFVAKQAGAMREGLSQTSQEINDWIGQIYQLAKSIDMFEANEIINRDRRTVPTDLENLKRRLKIETDAAVRSEIQDAIETRERLVASLRTIENNAKRTEIKMDNTVAQLSTVFAQMQLLNSRELDSGRAQRLREEIRDEIASLNDMVSAMGDVYDYGRKEKDYTAALDDLGEEDASQSTETPTARRASSQSK